MTGDVTLPHLAALIEALDDLDGRQVQINHTIEHVERVEDRRETPALRKAAHHRRKQYEVGL